MFVFVLGDAHQIANLRKSVRNSNAWTGYFSLGSMVVNFRVQDNDWGNGMGSGENGLARYRPSMAWNVADPGLQRGVCRDLVRGRAFLWQTDSA